MKISKKTKEILRIEIDNTQSLKFKEIAPFFRAVKNRCPDWSDYLCFAEVVRRTDRSREIIRKNFNKLVDKNDYVKEEKAAIMEYLYSISDTEK